MNSHKNKGQAQSRLNAFYCPLSVWMLQVTPSTMEHNVIFAYVIANQSASKRYDNIAVGRTASKEMENSI